MFSQHSVYPASLLELVAKAEQAAKAIPPAFPLSATVAVNPFLGQVDEPMPVTAARLARVAGIRIYPERSTAAKAIANGEITPVDIQEALTAIGSDFIKLSVPEVTAAAQTTPALPRPFPTISELATECSGIDWNGIIADRVGAWASAYFDMGQALWQPARRHSAYSSWREWSLRDLTLEIHGLRGFGQFVNECSRSPWRSLGRACENLGIDGVAATTVFHRLLCDLGGWAQYARHLDWNAALDGSRDSTTTDLLALRLVYEEALFDLYRDQIEDKWRDVLDGHRAPVTPTKEIIADAVLQHALELAAQRRLAKQIEATTNTDPDRNQAQIVFCIDVRSEVMRRAIEAQSPEIETLGFAGFFGIPVSHNPAASDIANACAPVLVRPELKTFDNLPVETDAELRFKRRAQRAWGRFKMAAVSSFAFVEAAGPVFAAKLIGSSLARTTQRGTSPSPVFADSLDTETLADLGENALRGMSLTKNFAPLVVLVGHGAQVTNNAHQSALQCGACGGHAGDVNARLLANLLNDKHVRTSLTERGITIPDDTLFLGALHDTTTDIVTIFDETVTAEHAVAVSKLNQNFSAAAKVARAERALKLPGATDGNDLIRRAADWSQLRPEWGLAGCYAFIVGPRSLSKGGALDGRSFLHSYHWREDDDFGVLESILTAPAVVTSWINLQYYGSSVAPSLFGGGNKLLHNVVGGVGVIEGNGGPLRTGLPWQSVHDGEKLQHDPLRLAVVVAAPVEAITVILEKNPGLRALFDNGWLHLIAMNDEGQFEHRYKGALKWDKMGNSGKSTAAIAAE